jgi:hypothetical protein
MTQLPPPEQYAAVELYQRKLIHHNMVINSSDHTGEG